MYIYGVYILLNTSSTRADTEQIILLTASI